MDKMERMMMMKMKMMIVAGRIKWVTGKVLRTEPGSQEVPMLTFANRENSPGEKWGKRRFA